MLHRAHVGLALVSCGFLACAAQKMDDGGAFLPQGGATHTAPAAGGDPLAMPSVTDPVVPTEPTPVESGTPDDLGGVAGMSGAPSTIDTPIEVEPEPEPTVVRPPCITDTRQVIVAGDSYVNWVSHTFPQDLAKAYGSSAVGVWDMPYTQGGRLYAIGGWAMGSGGIGLIPEQLGFATADDPDIRLVVMTGGGNDFLVPGAQWVGGAECRNSATLPPAQVCQDIVETAKDAARGLMQDAADAGVRDVVYFFYPNIPAPTLLGGTSPNTLLDWSYPQVEQLCADTESETGGRLRCHFLDLRPIFQGHPDWFVAGDIHENSLGSKAMADAIVQLMKDRCVGQPASSGCCEP